MKSGQKFPKCPPTGQHGYAAERTYVAVGVRAKFVIGGIATRRGSLSSVWSRIRSGDGIRYLCPLQVQVHVQVPVIAAPTPAKAAKSGFGGQSKTSAPKGMGKKQKAKRKKGR